MFPAFIAWLYGPIGAGAELVCTTFLLIVGNLNGNECIRLTAIRQFCHQLAGLLQGVNFNMKTALIIDSTGLGNKYIEGFGHKYGHWEAIESVDMVGVELPALVVFMQIPISIPFHWQMPVLINDTIGSFELAPSDNRPIARFCGWQTMVERPVWEIAAYNIASTEWINDAEELLNRKLSKVPNQPGFIAPRILASIINEACFGLSDNICTADDMDIAMRLGTNYPKGPIAWMHEIGKENIAALLSKLATYDKKYTPHPLLILD
jgi:hypothetical protein